MTCINRTTIPLILLSLLILSISPTGLSQDRAARKTFTISGNAGLSNVALQGLPGVPVTRADGSYSVQVEYAWSGTVKPIKQGYSFDPPSRSYTPVDVDLSGQDYVAKVLTFTISGRTGVSGVAMKGLPGEPITDENGIYAAPVRYGWGGIVTPAKEGFVFNPPNRNYGRVAEDQPDQDYTPKLFTFTISGNAGASGVLMQGLPDSTITDQNGGYTASVPYGWAGTVVPKKEGYSFEPVRKEYPRIVANVRNQDYNARARMLTISDVVAFMSGNITEPIAGVKVTAEPGGNSVMTDAKGRYAIQVPYGWTGRLIFSKEDMVFDPDSRLFTNVTSNIVSGQPQPSGEWPAYDRQPTTASRPPVTLPPAAGSVVVIPTAQIMPDKAAETAEDLRIMLQILRDKLSEPRMIRGAFVNFGDFFGDRDRALEAFYLQGSAAVFVLEMDSPFTFAPAPPGGGEAVKEAVDPVWQRARERLASPQNPALRDPRGLPGETGTMDFQQFQDDLLQTLRHAANLRNVDPNESIIVTIIAHEEPGTWPARTGGSSAYADSRTRSSGSTASRGRPTAVAPGPAPAATGTVLTLKVKKVEIDAFAKGILNFKQFQQRVKTFTY